MTDSDPTSLFDPADETLVVFDFETTGMSPQYGDRVIEVGAVRLEAGRIVERFSALINPGVTLSPFIVDLTGITDAMLAAAPAAEEVIGDFARFVGAAPVVAHNAAFDRRFLEAEFVRQGLRPPHPVGCSMLAARRVFPAAPNHKLGTLVRYLDLPRAERFHRALDDAAMTAALWTRMAHELQRSYGFDAVPFALLQGLGRVPRHRAESFLQREVQKQREGQC